MTKRCCCGVFSVTVRFLLIVILYISIKLFQTGAKILAALMILGAVGSIISVCVPNEKHTTGTRVGTVRWRPFWWVSLRILYNKFILELVIRQILSSVLELIAGSLVFMAINKKRAVLMIPILAYAVSLSHCSLQSISNILISGNLAVLHRHCVYSLCLRTIRPTIRRS